MSTTQRHGLGGSSGALIGLLLLVWVALQRTTPPGVTLAVALPLVGAVLGLGAVISDEGARPFLLRQRVPLPPADLHEHAVRWYAADGWTLTAAVDRSATLAFTRPAAPNAPLALLLLCFGIVPGVLYLLFGGRALTTTILTRADPDGADLEIIVNTRADGGESSAVRFFNSLHDLT